MITFDAKREIKARVQNYFRERRYVLSRQLDDGIQELADLEDNDGNGHHEWYQLFRRFRRWRDEDLVQKASKKIENIRAGIFDHDCAVSHLYADNLQPVLELLKNDMEGVIDEVIKASTADKKELIESREGQLKHVKQLIADVEECLKSSS